MNSNNDKDMISKLHNQSDKEYYIIESYKDKIYNDQLTTQIIIKKNEKLEKELIKIKKNTKKIQKKYLSLKKRKSVRAALKLAKVVWYTKKIIKNPKKRLHSLLYHQKLFFKQIQVRAASPKIIHDIKALRANKKMINGPLVSIIIVTRNGSKHMKRILTSLEKDTEYRNFEIIVVDNNSKDDTKNLLEKKKQTLNLHIIYNDRNTSFSKANNIAASIAKGEYLLFLNNDIKPINRTWLGAMIEELQKGAKTYATGALLLYPIGTTPARQILTGKNLDLTVQHKGIRFIWKNGSPHPVNMMDQNPSNAKLLKSCSVPAVTAACMLVKKEPFNRVNGFDEKYIYGAEDVDLCLRLRKHGGDIVFVGEAALFHYESSTQNKLTSNIRRINRTGNWQFFIERWGPTLHRFLSLDPLRSQKFWSSSQARKLAITLTKNDETAGFGDWYTAHELGTVFKNNGWDVTYIERYKNRWSHPPEDIDVVISLLDSYDPQTAPPHCYKVAWIRNWTKRWLKQNNFKKYDLTICSSQVSADIVQAASGKICPIIPLGSNDNFFKSIPPDPTYECDFAFTGNNWGETRSLLTHLTILKDEKFLLFGKGWETVPWMARYWRGHLSYKELPKLYSSAKIILDDTASHALPYGAINSRVFDALACGSLVITNNKLGSDELFDGLLPTYSSPVELRELLSKYLNNDKLRKDLAARLQERVLSHYTYNHIYRKFEKYIINELKKIKIAVKICTPKEEGAEFWGDTHFANCFGKALNGMGFRTAVHLMNEWDLPENQDSDIIIHLRGLHSYTPKSGAFNILWIISHPDNITIEECEAYDLVLVASHKFAEQLALKLSVPVKTFLQATDEKQFYPTKKEDSLQSDILFVGNTRNQIRPCIEWAKELKHDVHIYGKGWENRDVPTRMLKGEYFPNEYLRKLYSSSRIILNDHWPDMRENGFISNRIFDALACESFIISDDIHNISEIFDGVVPTYKNKKEFKKIIETFIYDDQKRTELARKGRELILSAHTFTHRAQQLKKLLSDYYSKPV